jgi:endonuclease/exonuclease/phosphatase family metal-dependent hydrolase
MPDNPIWVKTVNVHWNNSHIHALLQGDNETDILIIQEPWFGTVVTLRFDTDPAGTAQRGTPINNMWNLHLPKHSAETLCATLAYTRKETLPMQNIDNVTTHHAADHKTIILDIKDDDGIQLQLINVYHQVPKTGTYALEHLLNQDLDENTPTIIAGDFNTHSHRWSLPNKEPSRWASKLEDWLDNNGFELLTPPHEPTWFGSKDTDQPSVLDLAFANERAFLDAQFENVQISLSDSLSSDHAAITFDILPITSLALAPPPTPSGYKLEEERKASWMREFARVMPYAQPPAYIYGPTIHEMLAMINKAIADTNKETLRLRRPPHHDGARWWNEECSVACTLARSATSPIDQKKTARHLKYTIIKAKREWAHKQLHEAEEAGDIWRIASTRKGRWCNIFPALRNEQNQYAHEPDEKADLFRRHFFPTCPKTVETSQPSDPLPRPERTWTPITTDEITLALSTTKNSSAPGPSGIGYETLKWVHQVRPDVLTNLYNTCLDSGTHPWKEVMVVVINKPGKPDYSAPKAYRPISLLECMGKLLEKIIAKRFNCDIEQHSLLAMTQFGSRPQHNAIDAVTTVIHRAQATIATGHVGALLLFDISGFFDNINPARATHLLTNLGFPSSVCKWTMLFLSG